MAQGKYVLGLDATKTTIEHFKVISSKRQVQIDTKPTGYDHSRGHEINGDTAKDIIVHSVNIDTTLSLTSRDRTLMRDKYYTAILKENHHYPRTTGDHQVMPNRNMQRDSHVSSSLNEEGLCRFYKV